MNDNDSQIVTRPRPSEVTQPHQDIEIRKNLDQPTLYSDSVFIKVSDFGITLDFAQIVNPKQQVIVSSIGMSKKHAKALLKLLKKNLSRT